VTALVALAVGNLGAQDSTVLQRAHWMVGGSLGVVGSPRERVRAELTLIGMHFTQLKPGRLGADISINVMPRLLADGVLGGAAVLGTGDSVFAPDSLGINSRTTAPSCCWKSGLSNYSSGSDTREPIGCSSASRYRKLRAARSGWTPQIRPLIDSAEPAATPVR